ncbi:tetratricopeptide repeat protein [Acidobacteria bacterium AH-259-O06]|nr:tetratricopeptide repeat protein [Acidobacteria bacterium AH-259-O06]
MLPIEGKVEQAIDAYKKALEIEPNYKPAQDNLRFLYWLMGKYSYKKIQMPEDEARK